jgi:hypothetical protein
VTETERKIYYGLIERGLPPHVAEASVWNFKDESGLDPDIVERRPNAHGTRGKGLYQLTGSRRKAFENRYGADGYTLDNQLDYYVHELRGPEKRAYNKLMKTSTPNAAAAIITQDFLRPAKQYANARINKYLGQGGNSTMLREGSKRDYLRQFMTDEMIDKLVAAGEIPPEIEAAKDKMTTARGDMRATPRGMNNVGPYGTYIAANPLEHVATGVNNFMQNRRIRDAQSRLEALRTQQGEAGTIGNNAELDMPMYGAGGGMPPGAMPPGMGEMAGGEMPFNPDAAPGIAGMGGMPQDMGVPLSADEMGGIPSMEEMGGIIDPNAPGISQGGGAPGMTDPSGMQKQQMIADLLRQNPQLIQQMNMG